MDQEGALRKDQAGFLPLHLCCKHWAAQQATVATLLVDSKPVCIQVRDPDGNLPIHLAAAAFGRTETIEMLVQRWPNSIMQTTLNGARALDLARRGWVSDRTLELLEGHAPAQTLTIDELDYGALRAPVRYG